MVTMIWLEETDMPRYTDGVYESPYLNIGVNPSSYAKEKLWCPCGPHCRLYGEYRIQCVMSVLDIYNYIPYE